MSYTLVLFCGFVLFIVLLAVGLATATLLAVLLVSGDLDE